MVRAPYTGETLGEIPFETDSALQTKLEKSFVAFQRWKKSTSLQRSLLLKNAHQKLLDQREEFAQLICQEAGKPITLARGEVDRALGVLDWAQGETLRYAGELLRLDATPNGRRGFGIHTRFPRGPVLGITPFNFPLNLVMHKVAPALASGCSILIKPSPFTPLTATKCAQLFSDDLVQCVVANDEQSARLTQAKEVATISFTGSDKVGWMIRKQAPAKPTSLELGGNAWVIVCDDVPLSMYEKIAKKIAGAAFGYAGQSCISVQNVAIADGIWDNLRDDLIRATENTPYGDPSVDVTVCGPVIHKQAAERIQSELQKISKRPTFSSKSCVKGSTPPGPHAHPLITPTLVEMPPMVVEPNLESLVQNEIFAPVMTMRSFADMDHVLKQIQSSPYGLQLGIFTQHFGTMERVFREAEVGGVVINDVPTTRYDHQPYGGVKASGFGREGIRYAMDEMTESKFLALSSDII